MRKKKLKLSGSRGGRGGLLAAGGASEPQTFLSASGVGEGSESEMAPPQANELAAGTQTESCIFRATNGRPRRLADGRGWR